MSKSKFEFEAVGKAAKLFNKDSPEVGAWTDGVGVYSDNEGFCAFHLKKGVTYKVTIEELTNPTPSTS